MPCYLADEKESWNRKFHLATRQCEFIPYHSLPFFRWDDLPSALLKLKEHFASSHVRKECICGNGALLFAFKSLYAVALAEKKWRREVREALLPLYDGFSMSKVFPFKHWSRLKSKKHNSAPNEEENVPRFFDAFHERQINLSPKFFFVILANCLWCLWGTSSKTQLMKLYLSGTF